jgi:hypothetical protein
MIIIHCSILVYFYLIDCIVTINNIKIKKRDYCYCYESNLIKLKLINNNI